MKKFLSTILFTSMISIIFGNMIFYIYKKDAIDTIEVMNNQEYIYMVLYGSYNNMDKVNNLKLNNYILENDNGYYRVYIGVSKSLENATKIKEIYNKLGNNTYIRNIKMDNIEFIDYLDNVESDFNSKSDNEILVIENNIINKYKEIK